MHELEISSIDELKSSLGQYGERYLFRGQAGHYLDHDNRIAVPTSFKRHGCIPPLMFKWTHYSKALIRAFGGGDYHDLDMGVSQAILQHYGWRSFFIDLSKEAHIACWFAANKYSEKRTIHMCEDFEENPVWLVHKEAEYSKIDGNGHIYVIDKECLAKKGIKIYDLTELAGKEGRLRFQAQAACLAEAFDGYLVPDAIVAHFIVKSEVLVDYYQLKGLSSLLGVFPGREDDYVLKCLLDLPWYKIEADDDFSIPIFRRGLDIPEYDCKFTKHLSPSVTLFSPFWISDQRKGEESDFDEIPFFKIGEDAYFTNTNEEFDLAEVNKILEEYDGFAIELDGLIKIPEAGNSYEFEKGVLVRRIGSDTYSVSALVVEHPGHLVSGAGALRGWFYKVSNGVWERIAHQDQCRCNNDLRHELQFALLRVLNESLKDGMVLCDDELNYRHVEVKNA